jgi:hypothetical protein
MMVDNAAKTAHRMVCNFPLAEDSPMMEHECELSLFLVNEGLAWYVSGAYRATGDLLWSVPLSYVIHGLGIAPLAFQLGCASPSAAVVGTVKRGLATTCIKDR